MRAQDIMSPHFQKLATQAMRWFQAELEAGALVVIDESCAPVRILPLG